LVDATRVGDQYQIFADGDVQSIRDAYKLALAIEAGVWGTESPVAGLTLTQAYDQADAWTRTNQADAAAARDTARTAADETYATASAAATQQDADALAKAAQTRSDAIADAETTLEKAEADATCRQPPTDAEAHASDVSTAVATVAPADAGFWSDEAGYSATENESDATAAVNAADSAQATDPAFGHSPVGKLPIAT
jgi:hypothetical protein